MSENYVLEQEKAEIFSKRSPFMYHTGMTVRQEEGKNTTEGYFKKCTRNGVLNPYDIEVLTTLFRLKWLNRKMIEIIFGKSQNSVKKCLHKLLNHGFINRYYCTYPEEVSSDEDFDAYREIFSPPFYGCSQGVWTYFAKYRKGSAPYFVPTPIAAVRTLALNQFISACGEYSGSIFRDEIGFRFEVNGYVCSPGYRFIVRYHDEEITFIPVVIRREGKCFAMAADMIKMVTGTAYLRQEKTVPVCICEDIVHMTQAWKEFAADERIAPLLMYYTYDLAIPGGKLFDRMYACTGIDSDGNPIFQTEDFSNIETK